MRSAFSSREQPVWSPRSEEKQQEAFFRVWPRKEAYLKAVGVGLSYPLHCVEVTIVPDEPARLLRHGDAREHDAASSPD